MLKKILQISLICLFLVACGSSENYIQQLDGHWKCDYRATIMSNTIMQSIPADEQKVFEIMFKDAEIKINVPNNYIAISMFGGVESGKYQVISSKGKTINMRFQRDNFSITIEDPSTIKITITSPQTGEVYLIYKKVT